MLPTYCRRKTESWLREEFGVPLAGGRLPLNDHARPNCPLGESIPGHVVVGYKKLWISGREHRIPWYARWFAWYFDRRLYSDLELPPLRLDKRRAINYGWPQVQASEGFRPTGLGTEQPLEPAAA